MKQKPNEKLKQLEQFQVTDQDQPLTTNQGLKISNDEHSLKLGERGPTLLEDFHLREKITHFDHERIPERVVHARGSAAHGVFESYNDFSHLTRAKFLSEKGKQTPVFVRFSTVAGNRGSMDIARDARGFATKFYTEEGNYDLVSNNMPVFFIQDALKFPDLIHAVKPEPHNEIPQAQSAHDTFWDFVAYNQESAHMVLWTMSDRAIPRSYRTMEGFGVNTFRFVNKKGEAHFVKFHWKPLLGMQSVIWEEATKINGKDPDFHKRDLYDNIEAGNFPQYELCVQLIKQEDEFNFDFDILDPTKLWPEEVVPLTKLGVMTLNRNVTNFFAETEQVAFHPGHVVPGIDFSNDPLLQGRLFSYTDTQLIRLGGPNFHEIPINRPVCPFFNNQRDGYMRQTINTGRVAYHKNGLQNNTPYEVPVEAGGYEHYEERVEGKKIRARSSSFEDHFSQAIMFWNSQTDVEKQHIIDAFSFELAKVETIEIRQLIVDMFANVSRGLSDQVAENVGVNKAPENVKPVKVTDESPALSIYKNVKPSVKTKKVGLIAAPGTSIKKLKDNFEKQGITVEVISDKLGEIDAVEVKHTLDSAYPVLFDSIYIASSFDDKVTKRKVEIYIDEIYNHYKTLGAEEATLLKEEYVEHDGVVVGETTFLEALAIGRHFDRPLAIG